MAEHDFTFLPTDHLFGDGIVLRLVETHPANPARDFAPSYLFDICRESDLTPMGHISLRVGNNASLFYAGHIGYAVDEPFRGNRLARRAAQLLLPFAKAHGLSTLYISCSPDNTASQRTIMGLGATCLGIHPLPDDSPMREDGRTEVCVYRIAL